MFPPMLSITYGGVGDSQQLLELVGDGCHADSSFCYLF